MKYSLFFGETERRILAAETPKEVMQIAWQAGVLLPKKAVLELFAALPGGEMPEVEYVPHVDFKENTRKSKAIIRTGETTPYSNIILQSGCIF